MGTISVEIEPVSAEQRIVGEVDHGSAKFSLALIDDQTCSS